MIEVELNCMTEDQLKSLQVGDIIGTQFGRWRYIIQQEPVKRFERNPVLAFDKHNVTRKTNLRFLDIDMWFLIQKKKVIEDDPSYQEAFV